MLKPSLVISSRLEPPMQTYLCECGNKLHFANSQCVRCWRRLGYLPDDQVVSALDEPDGDIYTASNGRGYRRCLNDTSYDICNWMIPDSDPNPYCASCRLTQTIPNLNRPENLTLWYRMEQAKRRLLYTLSKLDLPLSSRQEDPQNGLAFAFLEDETQDSFGNELTVKHLVTTGHSGGVITLNLKEARHSARMAMREEMNENYRTLLGHLRHESGHYYWDRLIANTAWLPDFRERFGDERLDYRLSMQAYYDKGPTPDWQQVWVSAYASMHPWEDWAETWAHYLHMVDTLETASDYSFSVSQKSLTNPLHHYPQRHDKACDKHFERLVSDWLRLTTGLNALNRSMGLEDAYPFTLSSLAIEKLKFVHQVISQS